MRFVPAGLEGAYEIVSEAYEDARGFFARLRCSREFADAGIPFEFVQTNLSFNARKGTFRGLHYQIPPSHEGKLVRCVQGVARDLVVDLRPDSTTFLDHVWVELSRQKLNAVFVPPGCAHGFLTQEDGTLVLYEMTDFYAPELARGARWNDPLLRLPEISGIENIHPRDASYPDLDRRELEVFRA
jgi:dTDP-4-dehydrorhamnose 3,5-epimerase